MAVRSWERASGERSAIDVEAACWDQHRRGGGRIAVLIDGGGVPERCQICRHGDCMMGGACKECRVALTWVRLFGLQLHH